jgi:hypothetical protein
MFWAVEHSPEVREGRGAFMDERPLAWIPSDLPEPGPRI